MTQELETRSADFANYRQEIGSRLSKAESDLLLANSVASSSERTIATLRARNDELTHELDDALVKYHEARDSSSSKTQAFQNEIATQARLAKLWEQSAIDAKARIEQLESALNESASGDAAESAALAVSAQQAEARATAMESQVAACRREIEHLNAELNIANERLGSANGGSGLELLSPMAHVMSKVQGGALSLTQLYAEYLAQKQALEHEKRKNATIQQSFDGLIAELEARAPQLQEQRQEFSQMQLDLAYLSEELQIVTKAKETLERQHTEIGTKCNDQDREIQVYHQQVFDLSRQVQRLLLEIEEQGFRSSPLTDAEISALNRMLEHPHLPSSPAEGVISERLVLFKNIQELQIQNQQQLKLVRHLGAKQEEDERRLQKQIQNQENEAVAEANEMISKLNEEVRSLHTKSGAFARERDMFRRMLSNKDSQMVVDSPAPDSTDLLQLQNEFDTYKRETQQDQRTINEQLSSATAENASLSIQLAKATSQVSLATERYNILSGSLAMLRKENEDGRSRSLQLQETISKQEIRLQQSTEEIVSMRSLLSSLQAEKSNQTAEKNLLRAIEERTSKELEVVRTERDRLNGVVATIQAQQHERERSYTDMQKRSSAQLESLAADLASCRDQLATERAEVRRLTLSREQGTVEGQSKVESLLKQLASSEQLLAVANADRDNTKTRSADLMRQVAALEEKLSIFLNNENNATTSMTSEQQIRVELAELKAKLEDSKAEITRANEYAQEMQQVSAASEEALAEMNIAHDEFVASVEQQLSDKSKQIGELQQRIAEVLAEFTEAQQELSRTQSSEQERHRDMLNELKSLKASNQALSDIEEKYNIAHSYYRDDLRGQAEIAQEAQQNYEAELVKHAEAAQSLRALRNDYNQLRDDHMSLRKLNEAAEGKLVLDTQSWESQRELYERELSELRSRVDDLVHQNELLHNQFENFSRQGPVGDADDTGNVQEIVKFLRREKEIVDVSFELLQQEHKRVKQQLSQVTQALDAQRLMYENEKQQREAQPINTPVDTTELEVTRESNQTLRSENKRNAVKIKKLEGRIQELDATIEPLQSRLHEIEAENEARQQQIDLLAQDNERWKKRNQAILQKYDRIDPAELQELREKATQAESTISSLRTEIDTLKTSLAEREEALATLNSELSTEREKFTNLREQSKSRIGDERKKFKELLRQCGELQEQIEQLTAESALRQEGHNSAITANAESAEQTAKLQAELVSLQEVISEKERQLEESSKSNNGVSEDEHAKIQTELQAATTRIDELTRTANDLQEELLAANSRLAKRANGMDTTDGQEPTDKVYSEAELQDKLKEREESAEQALEAVKAAAEVEAEELRAAQRKTEEQLHKTKVALRDRVEPIVETRITKRLEAAKQAWIAESGKSEAVDGSAAQPSSSEVSDVAEAVKKAIEEQEADFQKKLAAAVKEASMKSNLQLKAREKQIVQLMKKITDLEAPKTDNGKPISDSTDSEEHEESAAETPEADEEKPEATRGRSRRGRGRGRGQGTKRVREADNAEDPPSKKAA